MRPAAAGEEICGAEDQRTDKLDLVTRHEALPLDSTLPEVFGINNSSTHRPRDMLW